MLGGRGGGSEMMVGTSSGGWGQAPVETEVACCVILEVPQTTTLKISLLHVPLNLEFLQCGIIPMNLK